MLLHTDSMEDKNLGPRKVQLHTIISETAVPEDKKWKQASNVHFMVHLLNN